MRFTSRYWAGIALAGVLTVTSLLLKRPEPLIGASGIGAWLFAQQYRFLRQTRQTVDSLSVTQTSSRDRVVKGDQFTVTVDVSADHDVPINVAVTCNPSVSVSTIDAPARRCQLEPGEQAATTRMTTAGTVAGEVSFAPPDVTLSDPSRFFEVTVPIGEPLTVQIENRSDRELHVGAGGQRLAAEYGEHDTLQQGAGLEPAEIREYSPGDEIRRIDWKATARYNYPHIRKYERKTQRRTALVVDHRAKMGFGPSDKRMLDHAVDVALLFLTDARRNGDTVGLYAVGDDGLTVETGLSSGEEQYNRLRRSLEELHPTSKSGSGTPAFTAHQGHARRLADRLRGSVSFDWTLRPYVSEHDAYVRRIESRPLFSAVRAHATPLRESTWTVIITDDSDRAELHDTVKLAQQHDGHVAVFLTPRVLFEEHAADERESAYRRYREFEEFRRDLMELDGVTAFEVGPENKLEDVLSVGRAANEGDGQTTAPTQPPGGGR